MALQQLARTRPAKAGQEQTGLSGLAAKRKKAQQTTPTVAPATTPGATDVPAPAVTAAGAPPAQVADVGKPKPQPALAVPGTRSKVQRRGIARLAGIQPAAAPAATPPAATPPATAAGTPATPPAGTTPPPDPSTMTPAQRKQYRHQLQEQSGKALQDQLPPGDPRRAMDPAVLYRHSASDNPDSAFPAGRRLQNLQALDKLLGYNQPQDQLTTQMTSELNQTTPGLSDAQAAAIRGAENDVVKGQAAQASRDAASALGAAGIDPRSGIGREQAMMIQRAQEQGLTNTERDITTQGLARQGQVESGLAQLAGLKERERQFDVDYTESARQAKAARANARKAGKLLQPSTLETTGTILGAIL